MLRVARRRADRNGWQNVELIESDVGRFSPAQPVDGVVFSICLSCVPNAEEVFRRAATFLRPGRPLVLVDAFINRGRWYYGITNLQNRVKGWMIGAKPENRLRETAQEILDRVEITPHHAGLYTLVRGWKRSDPAS
jgi:ubiquinone/menaquinone biosynthesis C-methylase UbiE